MTDDEKKKLEEQRKKKKASVSDDVYPSNYVYIDNTDYTSGYSSGGDCGSFDSGCD